MRAERLDETMLFGETIESHRHSRESHRHSRVILAGIQSYLGIGKGKHWIPAKGVRE